MCNSGILMFALKGIAFLALGLCISAGLTVAASHLVGVPQSTLEYRVNDLLTNHKDVEAIAVGHSHNKALDFSVLGINGYHAWAGGSDFFEVEYELRSLVPKLVNLRIVFMPMAYWGFRIDNGAVPARRVRNLDYYRAFHNGPITANDRWLYLRSSPWNIIRSDHWKDVVEVLVLRKKTAMSPSEMDRTGRDSVQADGSKPKSYEELVEHSKKRVVEYLQLQDACEAGHPNLEEETYECVVRIIKFLQARGIRVVFFTPPYFAAYSDLYRLLSPETIHSMKTRMRQLVDEYNVEYYDFSADEEFVHNHLVFSNSDHLNADGAVMFSKKLQAAMHAQETVDDL